MSTASLVPRSANAASIAAMQSGIFSRGSTSSFVSRIIARVRIESGRTIVHHRSHGKGRYVAKRTVHQTTMGLLAQAIRSFESKSVSPAAIKQAKLLLLDTIGCGLAGRGEPVAQAVLKAASREEGPCAVIGQSARTSPLNAVLLNGV